MINFYAINASVTRRQNGCVITREIPTFYLNKDVQGITCAKHAATIAADVVGTLCIAGDELNIYAYNEDGATLEDASIVVLR